MSFSKHLVLWVHVAFVIFTIGPVTLAIMSTPRYIRKRDIRILRYLTTMTFVFAVSSLGVLIAGYALASMIGKAGKPWVIISATLFVVAILLLGLIYRDQRRAIKAVEAHPAAASHVSSQPSEGAETVPTADLADAAGEPGAAATAQPPGERTQAAAQPQPSAVAQQPGQPGADVPEQVATVERGRIAMMGGVVTLLWLAILVLMVWNS